MYQNRNKCYIPKIMLLLFLLSLSHSVIAPPVDMGPLTNSMLYIYNTVPLPATDIKANSATLNGWYGWGSNETAIVGFFCDEDMPIDTETPFINTTYGSAMNQSIDKYVSGLDESTCHYFTVWVNITDDWYRSYLNESFLTKPSGPPANLTTVDYAEDTVNLTWDNVTDWQTHDVYQETIVRYSNTHYPNSPTDGTLGYNGTDEDCSITGLEFDTQYYFSAWTHITCNCTNKTCPSCDEVQHEQNSTYYSSATAFTQGGTYEIKVRYENRTYGPVNLSEMYNISNCGEGVSDLLIYDELSQGTFENLVTTDGVLLMDANDSGYYPDGNRTSPIYNLSGLASSNATVGWSAVKTPETNISVYYDLSTNGGATWDGWVEIDNGDTININGADMTYYKIKFKQRLTTTNNSSTSQLANLYFFVERECSYESVSGPHEVIIHYYGEDTVGYYGQVSHIIFANGTFEHDPMARFNATDLGNGSFNFSVNRTVKFIEFLWNNSDERPYRCNRIIAPLKGQRNITFYIRTDLPIYGEGTALMSNSIVKYIYTFVDENAVFRPPNEPRATIYTFMDNETKMIIHSEYFSATENIYPWLVYDKDYLLGVDCSVMEFERLGFAPASSELVPEIRIPFSADRTYNFYNFIDLEVGWYSDGFYVVYEDTTHSTVSSTFKVYSYSNGSLLYENSSTLSFKNYTFECNTSKHYVWLITNEIDDPEDEYDGFYSSGKVPIFHGTPHIHIDDIDDALEIILGVSPLYDTDNPDVVIPWSYIAIFAIAFIFLVTVGRLNSFIGTLGAGAILAFCGVVIIGMGTLIGGAVMMVIGIFLIAIAIISSLGGVEK